MAYHKVNIAVFILYMLGMTSFLIWQGIGITPDRYVLILILGMIYTVIVYYFSNRLSNHRLSNQ